MRRGSSGAVFVCVGDDVTKRKLGDDGRVAAQGRWLQEHSSPAVPLVYRVYDESYVMERLVVPPLRLLGHSLILNEMIAQLRRHVWSQPPVAPINHDMLQKKIERLLRDFDLDSLWTWIIKTHASIRWHQLGRCLTHGDPTFDNVMIREDTAEVVIVDPLPASLVIPDYRCVDLGKILQSVVGWERVRYGYDFRMRTDVNTYRMLLDHHLRIDDNEWRAAVFWCVVHLLRLLPYVDESIRASVKKELIPSAIGLL